MALSIPLTDTAKGFGALLARHGGSAHGQLAQNLPAVLAVWIPVVAFGWAGWSRRWMSDDGFIYLRVVDQLVAGNGPVFNAGERVEVATGPLWVVILTVATVVLRPIPLEWHAVWLGLILSLMGLALGAWGALRLTEWPRHRVVLPLGALVVVALPPFWDYATSGLETGLGFAWLGGCFWGLAREYRLNVSPDLPAPECSLARSRSSTWLAVVIGLGLLIRPDFVIFTIAFMATLLVLSPGASWRARLGTVAAAFALPLAYQIFRMGYYGSLVPNPAFAKEASASYWSQGWRYALDLLQPYWLLVPILGLAALSWLPGQLRRWTRRDLGGVALAGLPVVAAIVHALYIVHLGGDFMHGRMLLPALFGLLLPVGVVPLSNPLQLVAAFVVIPWVMVSALTLRLPYEDVGPEGIADERGFYLHLTGHPHPITVDDYQGLSWAVEGLRARDLAAEGDPALLLRGGQQIRLAPRVDTTLVVQRVTVGVFGYAAGTEVHVVDLQGLGDPIAGRLRLEQRGRPGHEKMLDEAWVVARFGDPEAQLPSGGPSPAAVAAGRLALGCDGAELLLDAVRQPMTPKRFLRNLFDSFRLHELRLNPDPIQALHELC